MSQYFIVKTGWEIFDLSRAYGLGILLCGLSERDVYVCDKAYYYELLANDIYDVNTAKLIEFLGDDLNWEEVLLTAPGKGRIDSLKVREIKDFLTGRNSSKRISNLLGQYLSFKPIEIPSAKGETLYQPMELGATKGLRDAIRFKKQYSEGWSIKVKKDDWMLSLLGHLNLTTWKYDTLYKRGANELLLCMPVPSPQGTTVDHLHSHIKKDKVEEAIKKIHQAGKMPTLAYMGVVITEAALDLAKTPVAYTSQFSSILYSSMKTTGKGAMKRWKPATAGIFPLEHLNEIAKGPHARSLLSLLKEIFRNTNKAGYEDLPTSLSRYLADPTFINFENYTRLHLRYLLTKKIKLPSYSKEMMTEVMENVRS